MNLPGLKDLSAKLTKACWEFGDIISWYIAFILEESGYASQWQQVTKYISSNQKPENVWIFVEEPVAIYSFPAARPSWPAALMNLKHT